MFKHIRLLLIIILTLGTLFIGFAPASAIGFKGLIPVGGLVYSQIFCANGVLLFVGAPRGGSFMYSPGARLYAKFAPFSGRHVLGLASPGGACTCPSGNCEAGAIGAQGTFVMLGTS